MNKEKFDLIDILVNDFPENGMFYVTKLASFDSQGDKDPQPWGETEEFESMERATSDARLLADLITARGWARRTVVFVNGNESYVSTETTAGFVEAMARIAGYTLTVEQCTDEQDDGYRLVRVSAAGDYAVLEEEGPFDLTMVDFIDHCALLLRNETSSPDVMDQMNRVYVALRGGG